MWVARTGKSGKPTRKVIAGVLRLARKTPKYLVLEETKRDML